MKLSIGVPAYNQGSYLRETLESLLRQDVPFDEIVVSDNHSTDSTPDVIIAMQAEHPGRIRLVTPPEHLKMAENWNFTVANMKGDWCSLLSSDDVALPNFAASVKAAAARSAGAVLVRGAWQNIGPQGELLGTRKLLTVAPVTSPPKTLYEQRFGPKGSFAAFALRRDVWERVGGFPEQVTLVGDWGMWLLAGALGDVVYTGDVIASYRVGHQLAVIRERHPVHVREMFTIYNEIMPRAAELGGFGRPAWIARASRTRFREMLTRTSREFAANDREDLVAAFGPWAQSVGEARLLERFARGDTMRSFDLRRMLVQLVRKM